MLRRAATRSSTPGGAATSWAWSSTATTDWAEVAELLTESYCVLAPKKLVALVDRPGRLEHLGEVVACASAPGAAAR